MNEKTAAFVWFVVTPFIFITAAMNYNVLKAWMFAVFLFAVGLSIAGK